jgi:hypothetical protein
MTGLGGAVNTRTYMPRRYGWDGTIPVGKKALPPAYVNAGVKIGDIVNVYDSTGIRIGKAEIDEPVQYDRDMYEHSVQLRLIEGWMGYDPGYSDAWVVGGGGLKLKVIDGP